MRRLVVLVLLLGFLIFPVFGVSSAKEDIDYSWGIVSDVSSGQIIVRDFDYDSEEEIDIAYAIDPNVELENVDSLEGIAIGDSVEIEYVFKGNNRVARVISVEKVSSEEE